MLGLLVGIAFAVSKLLQRRDDELLAATAPAPTWPPISHPPAEHAESVEQAVTKKQPAPKKAAAKKAPAKKAAPAAPWVDPVDGVCPTTHPVKGKLSSKLFHLPGMLAYERTKPDRCYLDPTAAEADGFTKAKR